MNSVAQMKKVHKRVPALLIAMAAMLALAFSMSAPAQANPESGPTSLTQDSIEIGGSEVGAQQDCIANFTEGMTHRAEPNGNSPALGVIPAGVDVPAGCMGVVGATYTVCGITWDIWVHVYWNGSWGYAAAGCLPQTS